MNKHVLNTAITIPKSLDGLGMEKPNINNVKSRQPKERLPQLLISRVMQYDFVNYKKIGRFPKLMNKIQTNQFLV